MDEKEISRLEELAQHAFKCPNIDCCSYLEYDQCYNHSHVICSNYEKTKPERKRPNSDAV